jgi:hypothetical protein
MLTTLIGANVNGKPNYITIAHVGIMTLQSVSLGMGKSHYTNAGITILGVSPDNPKSHAKFKAKYGLPFPLLADDDHKVCELYKVWGVKKGYGREYNGVFRTTYLIDKTGKIIHVFENVKYVNDPAGRDYWAPPNETLHKMSGDCEDHALLLAALVTAIPGYVFLEASLAVLGLGDPVLPTWGKILNDAYTNGALYQGYYYWVIEPAVFLMLAGASCDSSLQGI